MFSGNNLVFGDPPGRKIARGSVVNLLSDTESCQDRFALASTRSRVDYGPRARATGALRKPVVIL